MIRFKLLLSFFIISLSSILNSAAPEAYRKSLMKAIVDGDKERVKVLIAQEGLTLDFLQGGKSPLTKSVTFKKFEIFTILLDKGVSPDYQEADEPTAIHYAANNGHKQQVSILLDADVDVNTSCAKGITPLHCALEKGHIEIVRLLIERGADRHKIYRKGYTPEILCCIYNQIECLRELMHYDDVELERVSDIGDTPLHAAAGNGSIDCVKALVEAGVSLMSRNNTGETVLDLAIKRKKEVYEGEQREKVEQVIEYLKALVPHKGVSLKVWPLHVVMAMAP